MRKVEKVPVHYSNGLAYAELHHRFIESEIDYDQKDIIRFERFKPDHITNEQWVQLLGADTDVLKHMPVTYGLTRSFLRECRTVDTRSDETEFTEEQEEVLLLAAITNNWGESRTGNIAYDKKTTEIESEEKDEFRKIFADICGEEIDVKIRMLVERTVFDKYSRLGQAFNAIERSGYLRTALRAYKEAQSTDDEILAGHLQWLCANVLSNQIMMLVEYSKTYPPIRKFLTEQHALISEAFESLDIELFSKHGQNESIRSELFWQNKRSWYEFNRYEAQDLKHEIISTAMRFTTDEWPQERVSSELESLLDAYGKVISGSSNGHAENGEAFDKGLFGNRSSFEARLIFDQKELKRKVEAIKELGLKIVLTSGSFDLLHIGHAGYLEKAKEYGDVLVVGVDDDEKMKRKGPDRPMIPQAERTRLLSYLRGVDIITNKRANDEKWSLIKLVEPDTLITTQETYTGKEIAELHEYCGRVVVLPPQATTSTSAKIRRMNLGFGKKFLEHARTAIDELIMSDTDLSRDELCEEIYKTLEVSLEEILTNG